MNTIYVYVNYYSVIICKNVRVLAPAGRKVRNLRARGRKVRKSKKNK
jgi:hypothetical protein